MKDRSIRTFTRVAALTVALLLLVSCAAAEAVDTKTTDPYLELSTQYPAMTVKAGDSLTFALSLDNYSGASQDITLSVEALFECVNDVFGIGIQLHDARLLQRQQQTGQRGACEK